MVFMNNFFNDIKKHIVEYYEIIFFLNNKLFSPKQGVYCIPLRNSELATIPMNEATR